MTLVDSDILSEHLRGAPEAQDWLLRARSMTRGLAVSAASIVEVAGGMRSGERSEVGGCSRASRFFTGANESRGGPVSSGGRIGDRTRESASETI